MTDLQQCCTTKLLFCSPLRRSHSLSTGLADRGRARSLSANDSSSRARSRSRDRRRCANRSRHDVDLPVAVAVAEAEAEVVVVAGSFEGDRKKNQNVCVRCQVDIGDSNARQYCGKYVCDNEWIFELDDFSIA